MKILWLLFLHCFNYSLGIAIVVNNFSYSPCNKENNYSVIFSNFHLKYSNGLLISGNIEIKENLTSPIRADVIVKRDIIGIWVEVPCEKNIGSCNYQDLCIYNNNTDKCPEVFKKNGVPCKCPFPQGNYTIPESFILGKSDKSVLTGKYFANVKLFRNNSEISCYNVEFYLTDDIDNNIIVTIIY